MHHRKVLLAKLEELGMTEEEWYAQKKKRKIKRDVDRRKRAREREKLKGQRTLDSRTSEEILRISNHFRK